jgi:hypothetical protein
VQIPTVLFRLARRQAHTGWSKPCPYHWRTRGRCLSCESADGLPCRNALEALGINSAQLETKNRTEGDTQIVVAAVVGLDLIADVEAQGDGPEMAL